MMKHRSSLSEVINKFLIVILFAVMATVSLVSCAQDIRMIPDVDDGNRQTSGDQPIVLGDPNSNGSALLGTVGDDFGLFILDSNSTLAPSNIYESVDNALMKYNSVTTVLSFDDNRVVYYPNDGSLLSFVSYTPYVTPITNYQLPIDVSDQTDPDSHDLLYAREDAVAKQSTPVELHFNHMMSKITLEIGTGGALYPADLDGMVVRTAGWPVTASFALTDGTFSGAATQSSGMSVTLSNPGGAKSTVEQDLIFIPNNESDFPNRSITFYVGGKFNKTYTWQVPTTQEFLGGTHYTLKVTVLDERIVVEPVSITPWVQGGTGNANTDDIVDYAGDGSYSDPYRIYTARGLVEVLTPANYTKHFILMKNIDLGDYLKNNNLTWTPIPLSGTFDGNGYAINGVSISMGSSSNNVGGLFTTLNTTGSIVNLGLTDLTISGGTTVGGLVGMNYGKIENCYVSGSISGTGSVIGGLVGLSTPVTGFVSSGIIKDCQTYVTISCNSTSHYVGGLVGRNWGQVENCDAVATVTSSGNYIGGFCGENKGTIVGGSGSVSVTGGTYVGGFVGINLADSSISGATVYYDLIVGTSSGASGGTQDGEPGIGGFAGSNSGTIDTCNAYGKYSTSQIMALSNIGGFVGGNNSTGIIETCTTISKGSLNSQQTFSGNCSIGGFVAQNRGVIRGSSSNINSIDNSIGGLYTGGFVAVQPSAYSGTISISECTATTKEINGVSASLPSTPTNTGGFIGYWGTGVIKDSEAYVQDITGYTYVGGFVGYAPGGGGGSRTISGCTVTITGTVKGIDDCVGGFAGYMQYVGCDNCIVNLQGSVIGGSFVGGFVGSASSSPLDASIVNCTVISSGNGGDIEGASTVGGFTGDIRGMSMSNCTTSVRNVTGTGNTVGGFAGYFAVSSSSSAIGTTLTNCHVKFQGSISAPNQYCGGFIANMSAGSIRAGGIENCSVTGTGNTSTISGGASFTGGFVGRDEGVNISRSYVENVYKVESTGSYTGGFIGSNSGVLKESYARISQVKGVSYVGGFLGHNSSEVYNSYSIVPTVFGTGSYIGGFIGRLQTINNSQTSGKVFNCYSVADSVTGSSEVGGFLGGMVDLDMVNVGSTFAVVTDQVHATRATTSYLGYFVGYKTSNVNLNDTQYKRYVVDPQQNGEKPSLNPSSGATILDPDSVTKIPIGRFTTPTFFAAATNWLNAPWDTTIWNFVSGDYPRLLNTP